MLTDPRSRGTVPNIPEYTRRGFVCEVGRALLVLVAAASAAADPLGPQPRVRGLSRMLGHAATRPGMDPQKDKEKSGRDTRAYAHPHTLVTSHKRRASVCVCVCVSEREGGRERERKREKVRLWFLDHRYCLSDLDGFKATSRVVFVSHSKRRKR